MSAEKNKPVWNIPDESYGEIGQKGGFAQESVGKKTEGSSVSGTMADFEKGIKGGQSANKTTEESTAEDIQSSDTLNEDILADTQLTGDIYEINDDYPEDGER